MKLKNYPLEERPREKAFHHGIESLNNIELLALVLRTGNKQESAIELAQRVINEIGGFRYLHDINYYQLIQIKGIKQAKAIEVLAIIEIAKRLDKQPVAMSAIKEPRDGYELLKNQLMFEQQEKVIAEKQKELDGADVSFNEWDSLRMQIPTWKDVFLNADNPTKRVLVNKLIEKISVKEDEVVIRFKININEIRSKALKKSGSIVPENKLEDKSVILDSLKIYPNPE